MDLLDQRVVMIVFGDNANLSCSAAKTIGALLLPEVKDRPGVAEIRQELERFLDDQKEGYAQLYDAKAGLFYFGWDATRDRLFGWEDLQGNWTTGHMDYLVNEFRGPTTFVALRYGLPIDAVANLGFKMKPYRMRNGKDVYVLAPWEGSAFQALGLGLSMAEMKSPSWRAAAPGHGRRRGRLRGPAPTPRLPLGVVHGPAGSSTTGAVGIPEITVSPRPRVTDAASLYTLGVAYSIDPEKVEPFLAENWPVVSKLFTDHGPWEGFNTTTQEVIRFQTTAHTLSLILGMLGTGSDHMTRYLNAEGARPPAWPSCTRPAMRSTSSPKGARSSPGPTRGAPSSRRARRDDFRVESDRADEVGHRVRHRPGRRG